MEKTLEEWYNTLKAPYRQQAKNNAHSAYLGSKVDWRTMIKISLASAISSFSWDKTPEGGHYWGAMCSTLHHNPIHPDYVDQPSFDAGDIVHLTSKNDREYIGKVYCTSDGKIYLHQYIILYTNHFHCTESPWVIDNCKIRYANDEETQWQTECMGAQNFVPKPNKKHKFCVGDYVMFTNNNGICDGKFKDVGDYKGLDIPEDLIKHGSPVQDITKGVARVVAHYKEYNIVSFIDEYGKEVQLGFKDAALDFQYRTAPAEEVHHAALKLDYIEEYSRELNKLKVPVFDNQLINNQLNKLKQNEGKSIKINRLIPRIRQGERPKGISLRGRTREAAISSRPIGYSERIISS